MSLRHLLLILSFILLLSCTSKYRLEEPPGWYKQSFSQDYIDVNLFLKEGYTRFEALEIQNSALDMMEADKALSFKKALSKAKSRFQIEKRGQSMYFPPASFKPSDFIAVFDLDETSLSQWYKTYEKGSAYKDLCTGVKDVVPNLNIESTDCVVFTPNLKNQFDRIKSIEGCRGIVLFTAKGDDAANAIFDSWVFKDENARDYFEGFFTRRHLTRGGKVFKASKDIRIIDSSLKNAVIIDDNPSRLFQPGNVRVFPKFNADKYLAAKLEKKDRDVLKHYESLFEIIVDEIEDSYTYSKNNSISFVEAFYPYSQDGNYCMRMVQDIYGYSKKKSADFIRKYPDLCDPEFYGTKIKK